LKFNHGLIQFGDAQAMMGTCFGEHEWDMCRSLELRHHRLVWGVAMSFIDGLKSTEERRGKPRWKIEVFR
jgi:hypothetical protein